MDRLRSMVPANVRSRVVEGIIGWLIGKLSLHGYFSLNLTVNVARQ